MTAPYIDPKLPTQYRKLIEKLMQSVGAAPDSVLYERPSQAQAKHGLSVLANYDLETRAMRLSPQATMPRKRLMHEFGHLLQFTNSPLFFEWLDPLSEGKTPTIDDLERFADEFAETFEQRERGTNKGNTTIRRFLDRDVK